MAGIKNNILWGKNADFSSSSGNIGDIEPNGLFTNGQMWIGSTATNAGGTHVNVGTLTSPDNSITFGYSSPNITATVNQSVVPDLHVARYIVASSTAGTGANYTTITAAIAAAVGSGVNSTIAIQPGTYTENFTLPPGINLVAFTADATTPNVTIVGTITMTAAGTSSISGIRLQTNSAALIAVTGSANSALNLINCYLNITNNTGITYTSSGASSGINIINCNGDIGTTGITCFTHSGAGQIVLDKSIITNNGQSTTASTCSSGAVSLRNSRVGFAITTSSTASFVSDYSFHESPAINLTMLTLNGTGSVQRIDFSYIGSGSSSAISIGAGVTVETTDITVNSSNANAITGAGTLNYGFISSVNGTALAMNVTTVTPRNNMTGAISFNKGANYLDTYTVGTWTPTIVGGTTAGTTTYGVQNGYYTKIGNLVTCLMVVTGGPATGTGDVNFGGLPFTIKNQTNGNTQSPLFTTSGAGLTWPASTTCGCFQGAANTAILYIAMQKTAGSSANMQMANTTLNFQTTITYQV